MLRLVEKACSGCTKATCCAGKSKLEMIEDVSRWWPKYLEEAIDWWIDLDCPNRVGEAEDATE